MDNSRLVMSEYQDTHNAIMGLYAKRGRTHRRHFIIAGLVVLLLVVAKVAVLFQDQEPSPVEVRYLNSKDTPRGGAYWYSGNFFITNKLNSSIFIPNAIVEVRRNGSWIAATNESLVLLPIAPHTVGRFSIAVPSLDNHSDAWRARLLIHRESRGVESHLLRAKANIKRLWNGQSQSIPTGATFGILAGEVVTETIPD